tara:strand:+ start:1632 stop:3056 length:1425 start_codon:yes stop_codon:yes gene_type:complete
VTLLIPDFSKASVLVVGDVMLDRYLFGDTSRISPEAPVPVVHVHEQDYRPGGAANVAINLSHLGATTTLFGIIGDDNEGETLQAAVADYKIDCQLTKATKWPTITKTRVQSRAQQLLRLDREQPLKSGVVTRQFTESLAHHLDSISAVVLSDYDKGTLSDVTRIISVCRKKGIPVYVDPKGRDFQKYKGATVITPNQREFEAVVGVCSTEEDLVLKARKIIKQLGLVAVLITRSDKGMVLVEENVEPLFLAAETRDIYDVTGAGDTVIAVFANALAVGESFSSAATLSNLAAGLVVEKIGVASVTPSELGLALHRRGQDERGLLDETQLLSLVSESRERGERIVMTNGCFDILHGGHVSYLEEAKSLGDRLIVAINDDASVRTLKGETRPINKLEDRMGVVGGLAAVDWVVSFSEDTPQRLISSVLPDLLVKGGDYQIAEIAGADAVLANNGEVRILKFHEGYSSSRIIDKLSG